MADSTSEQTHCVGQILIPPSLPSILKKYAKAAIRTQPFDLLVWSAAYFKAMVSGDVPPVKARLEYPPVEMYSLSFGYIKLLLRQFGKQGSISRTDIVEKWNGVCLPTENLENIFKLGRFGESVDIPKFIAIAVGFLEKTLKQTMIRVCEILTEEPEGGSAMIDAQLFILLYRFLAEMECGLSDPHPNREEFVVEKKKPSICEEASLQEEASQAPEWDSVIRQIGEKQSVTSIETPLDRTGKLPNLDWPDIDAIDFDVKMAKEFDEYTETESETAVEIFEGISDNIGEMPEKEVPHFDIKMYDLDQQSQLPNEADDTKDRRESLLEEKMPEPVEEFVESVSEMLPKSDSSIKQNAWNKNLYEVYSDHSNLTVFRMTDCSPRSCENSEVSSGSEDLTFIDIVKDSSDYDLEKALKPKLSIDEMRFTFNTETRKKKLLAALAADEEKRRAAQLLLEKEEQEEMLKAQAEIFFWMWVPGIGKKLPEEMIKEVETYVLCCAEGQAGVVMPRNLRHFTCPPLDLESLDMKNNINTVLGSPRELTIPTLSHEETLYSEGLTTPDAVAYESWTHHPSEDNSEVEPSSTFSILSDPSVGVKLKDKLSMAELILTHDKEGLKELMKLQYTTQQLKGVSRKKSVAKKSVIEEAKTTEAKVNLKPTDWLLAHWREKEGMDLPEEDIKFEIDDQLVMESQENSEIDDGSFTSQRSLLSPSTLSIGTKLQAKHETDDLLLTLNEEAMKKIMKSY